MDKEGFIEEHSDPRGEPARSYVGYSAFDEDSTAESFHKAVQKAAHAAAADLPGGPEWFEVTRVRILVGNPNVKVYSATITASQGSSG